MLKCFPRVIAGEDDVWELFSFSVSEGVHLCLHQTIPVQDRSGESGEWVHMYLHQTVPLRDRNGKATCRDDHLSPSSFVGAVETMQPKSSNGADE
jgi:hypothetical protein